MRHDDQQGIGAAATAGESFFRGQFVRSFLIGVAVVVLVAFVVTVAWFVNSKVVTATGMSVSADPTSNLVISNNANIGELDGIGNSVDVDFAGTGTKEFEPATHYFTGDGSGSTAGASLESGAKDSGLRYVTNPRAVGLTSGVKRGDPNTSDLALAPVPVSTTSKYYYDYEVYLASAGKELMVDSLKASFKDVVTNPAVTDDIDQANYIKALSVDFYVNEATAENYRGTLNHAGFDAKRNDHSTKKTETELVASGTTVTLPRTSEAGTIGGAPLKVIMRCYYDGALLSGNNQAFVYTNKLKLANVTLSITFTAKEQQAD